MRKQISLIYRYPKLFRFKHEFKKLNNSIILLGTPLHKNLGDHLIAEAEKLFLKDCYPGKSIFEIPTEVFMYYKQFIQSHINKDILVFITGGGWMGTLWKEDEEIMQNMLEIFHECKIVILPQTIYYEKRTSLLDKANKVMSRCENLKVCVRDEASYEFAKQYFETKKIILAPDMGLYYTCGKPNIEKHGVGVFLRKDREKLDSSISNLTLEYLKHSFELKYSDTIAPNQIPLIKRAQKISELIQFMQGCNLIVTDRLHGMIYSVISGTKCIVFNNKTGKVNGVYSKWLSWNSDVLYLNKFNADSIQNLIEREPEKKNYKQVLSEDFENLKRFIL